MYGSGAPSCSGCVGGRGGTKRCRRGECGGGDTPCVRAADGVRSVFFLFTGAGHDGLQTARSMHRLAAHDPTTTWCSKLIKFEFNNNDSMTCFVKRFALAICDTYMDASRKIGRKLKTKVSLLILVCLAMPTVARDNDLDFTVVPITSLTIRHCGHILIAANAKNNELYMSMKSRNPTEESINLNRNNDIKILKRVRTQLKVARNHFRNNREVIARFYSDVKTVMQTNYHYEWLPSQSLVWYKKHVKKLDKDTKVFILLPVLRDSLHNFSVTLEQMRLFNETHFISNYSIRKLMLDDLSKHLIAVLCEVESAMISLSTWHNRKMPDGPQTTIVGGPGWDPNPDHTTMMIQDWGVLTIYYRFLKDWLHISRKMVQDQVDFHQRWTAVSAVASDNDDGDDNDDSSSASTIDRLLPVTPLLPSPSPLSPLLSSPLPCIRHRRCGSSKFNKRPKKTGSVT